MFYLYVDDLIYISNCDKMLIDFKNVTMDEFETSDLGLVRYFLGIQMKQKNINFLFIKRSMWLICWNDLICQLQTYVSTYGYNEKLKRDYNDELTNEQIYKS